MKSDKEMLTQLLDDMIQAAYQLSAVKAYPEYFSDGEYERKKKSLEDIRSEIIRRFN